MWSSGRLWRGVYLATVLIVGQTIGALVHSAEFAENLTEKDLAEGWISLFDGKTFFGWKPSVDANWAIEDGTIVVSEGGVGLLRTTAQYGDYYLRVDFRCEADTNSGIFLRTPPQPTAPERDCYELNIAPPDNPFPTGSFVMREKVTPQPEAGQWHTYEVMAARGHFIVKLDGQQILDYTDPTPLGRGFIGLQHNSGKVEFRNIRLKPLGLQPLFNGVDLSQWNSYPDMTSKYTITPDGLLNVQDGPGQLETVNLYGDFVFQLECISHGENLNSGIFFRCIPGDRMMGYESQIHSGYTDNDRTKPIDCGTGGIFRRKNARRVVSDDHEWFYKTIVAEGPHFAVWVNGYQVCDWTDQRPPHENPRKGLRLSPGTLMIQGHDPTTNLSFRNLRIGEMAKRW